MKKIIIRIVIAVLIVGTAAFFILFSKYSEEDEQKYKNSYMSKKELEEDYAFVWDFIENGYPFKNVCIRAGADLEKIKKDYFKKLPDIKDELECYLFYMSLLSKIQNNKHIGHLDVYDVYSLNSDTYRVQNTNVYDNDVKVNSFYYLLLMRMNSAIEQNRSEELLKKYDLNLNPTIDLEAEDGLESYFETKIIKDKKIAYLNIKSFYTYTNEIKEAYKKRLNSILTSFQDYENLIIDLRENRGGVRRLWQDCIVSPLIKKEQEFCWEVAYNSNNKFTKTFIKDFHSSKLEPNRNFDSFSFSSKNKPDKENFDSICSYTKIIKPLQPSINFSGKIWLLIGSAAESAADEFASFAKQTKFANVIGENTSGNGLNSSRFYLKLPNSSLLIQSDILYGFNSDGSCNSEVGTAPDIYNLPGKDALETCLEEIRKLGERTNF